MKETWKEKLQRKVREIFGNEQGVTLIELLAVVVILAIIAAVAVPAVMGNFSSAKTNSDKQNMTIIAEAINRLVLDESQAQGVTVTGLSTIGSTSNLSNVNLTATDSTGTSITTGDFAATKYLNSLLVPKYMNSEPTPQSAKDTNYKIESSAPSTGIYQAISIGSQPFYIVP